MLRGRIRKIAAAFLTGAFMVTSAWAGMSVMPARGGAESVAKARAAVAPAAAGEAMAVGAAIDPSTLPEGQVLAGAAKISMKPRPGPNDTWETDPAKCQRMDPAALPEFAQDDHLAGTGSPWPENPNCIYMGGFGLGPANPVTKWPAGTAAEPDLFVRAMALRDRQGDDFVQVIIDAEGYLWEYGKKCTDCGIKQLTERLAAKNIGLAAKDIVIASTHSHAAPEFLGGWGFVPDWYMKQISETIIKAVEDAVAAQQPAILEYGEEEARQFNSERRDTYRAAEEQNLAWLRATEASGASGDEKDTIFTMGAYAAHPTSKGTNGGTASPDWPGFFEAALEERFGGIGLHFMTGLGNLSNSGLGSKAGTDALAGLIPDLGDDVDVVDNPDIRTARTTWIQPVTNVPLSALGLPGFFDRKFNQAPAELRTGEDPDQGHCVTASAVSVELPVSAARVGELAFSAAPGEIFANFSNSVKEVARRQGADVAFPLGQANDALGYMPQSFELHPVGQQGLGFVAGGAVFVNYEDSYSIDKCVGDHALETQIGLLDGLK
jgi:hypothetical protein